MTDVVVSESGDSFDVVGEPVAHSPPPVGAAPRHPRWPEAARAFVRRNPFCAVCRTKSDLQVHHELPFHLFPAREMDESLWHVLCRRCHLFVGHLGDFRSYNPRVRADAAEWAARFADRPTFEGSHDG